MRAAGHFTNRDRSLEFFSCRDFFNLRAFVVKLVGLFTATWSSGRFRPRRPRPLELWKSVAVFFSLLRSALVFG